MATERNVARSEEEVPVHDISGEPGIEAPEPPGREARDQHRAAMSPPANGMVLPPQRLHPAWIFIHLVRSIRGFLVPLIFVFFTGGRNDLPFLAIAGASAVVGLAATTASWWVFRYEVAEGKLRVHSGLISRQERSVPLERIQSIDIGENLLQRLFGVVRVKVETAAGGGKGSDVTLEAMTRHDAVDLANRLRAVNRMESEDAPGPGSAIEVGSSGTLIKELSVGELLVAGATSGRIGPALAIVGGVFQFADELMPDQAWSWVSRFSMDVSVQGVVVGLAVIAVIAWVFAIASTVLTFGGFSLRRDGDHLLISTGLLDRRRSSIPLSRVQAITISEGMLRQPFGLASLRIESAGYGANAAESGVLFPLIRLAEVSDVLARAVPEMAAAIDVQDAAWHRPPGRALTRYIFPPVWRLVPITIAAVWIAVEVAIPWWWGLGVLLATPLMVLYGYLQYRDSGWLIDSEDRLIVRGRTIARWMAIMPRRRLQRRSMTRNPFQRRAALATFHAAVASGGSGGRVVARHLDESQAGDLLVALGPVQSLYTRT
jgi:putative membrane protein